MHKARILLAVIGMLLITATVYGATEVGTNPHSESYWRARIVRIHRGLKRAKVEKILPVHSEDQERTEGSGYLSVYAVDSEWVVEVPYDSNGLDLDPKRNPNLLLHLYDNRVAGRIRLVHQHTDVDWKVFPPTR